MTVDLVAECDRICGVESNFHEDECPLYKANCAAIDRIQPPLPVVPKMPPACPACGGSGFALGAKP